MEGILLLGLMGIVVLGPIVYLLGYAHDIFGLPRWLALVYVGGLLGGHFLWKPMVLPFLGLFWLLIIVSWGYILFQILFRRD